MLAACPWTLSPELDHPGRVIWHIAPSYHRHFPVPFSRIQMLISVIAVAFDLFTGCRGMLERQQGSGQGQTKTPGTVLTKNTVDADVQVHVMVSI
jgi:hypothetical protein